jgi:hypothetical protein
MFMKIDHNKIEEFIHINISFSACKTLIFPWNLLYLALALISGRPVPTLPYKN